VTHSPTPLERAVEVVLTVGLVVSGLLLLAGLLLGRAALLRYGILILMATPVGRVVVVTLGLFSQKDWVFGLISLWILLVIVSGMFVSPG
jgi:uncharacterized membrane protein